MNPLKLQHIPQFLCNHQINFLFLCTTDTNFAGIKKPMSTVNDNKGGVFHCRLYPMIKNSTYPLHPFSLTTLTDQNTVNHSDRQTPQYACQHSFHKKRTLPASIISLKTIYANRIPVIPLAGHPHSSCRVQNIY